MNLTNYIFLDLDGVLALPKQYNSNRKHWHPVYDCYKFDAGCVEVFNEIIEETNPIIILSSDWKLHYDINELNDIFKWNGVKGVVHGKTPSSWGIIFKSSNQLEECRAFEILKYVKKLEIINYVAIDDLKLSEWIDNKHFVHCPKVNEVIKQLSIKNKIVNNLKQI